MKVRTIAKFAVGLTTSFGVGTIAGHAIKLVLPPQMSVATKVTVLVGTYFIGAMAGEKVGEYACDQIDLIADVFDEVKKAYQEAKEEIQRR